MAAIFAITHYFHQWFNGQDLFKQLFLFFMMLSFVWIIFKGLSKTMIGLAGKLAIGRRLAGSILTTTAFIGGIWLTYYSFAFPLSNARHTIADLLFCGFILEIILVFVDDLIKTGLFEPDRNIS